jgi:hypothetical protein
MRLYWWTHESMHGLSILFIIMQLRILRADCRKRENQEVAIAYNKLLSGSYFNRLQKEECS